MEPVSLRNLDQIQENEPRRSASRVAALLLGSIGVGALVAVAVMGVHGPRVTRADDGALDDLLKKSRSQSAAPAERLEGREVTFPAILSDDSEPTTALAAVKDERGRLSEGADQRLPDMAPPPAGDRLTVAPLPAGSLLNSTSVTLVPKDPLTALAGKSSSEGEPEQEAPPGTDGKFQIQVASFKGLEEAEHFVQQLRQRGHRAHRVAAMVPNRGLWHRVRIGPFENKYEAEQYRQKFEKKERMAAFVVDLEKVRRAERIRADKLAAREQRDRQ
jgi:cell division septation protein DedD